MSNDKVKNKDDNDIVSPPQVDILLGEGGTDGMLIWYL